MQCLWSIDGQVCQQTCQNSASLHEHVKSVHIVSLKRNPVCYWQGCCRKLITFKKKFHLLDHVAVHSKYRPFVCETCGKGLAKRCSLLRHQKLHDREPISVQCLWKTDDQVCGVFCADQSTLQKHAYEKHVAPIQKARVCHWDDCTRDLKPLPKKIRLTSHLRTHTKAWQFQCELCKKRYSANYYSECRKKTRRCKTCTTNRGPTQWESTGIAHGGDRHIENATDNRFTNGTMLPTQQVDPYQSSYWNEPNIPVQQYILQNQYLPSNFTYLEL